MPAHTHKGNEVRGYREKGAICNPKRELFPDTDLAGAVVLDFRSLVL